MSASPHVRELGRLHGFADRDRQQGRDRDGHRHRDDHEPAADRERRSGQVGDRRFRGEFQRIRNRSRRNDRSYAWNFGDGGTGSGANASHTYAAAGTFTATLTVTDNKGATATDTAVVTTVTPCRWEPAAGRQRGTRPDRGCGRDRELRRLGLVRSRRQYLRLHVELRRLDGDRSGAAASHVFTGPGVYTVTLHVIDSFGLPGSDTAIITVTGPGPSRVTGLTAVPVSCSQVNLAWNPSTAAAGINHYEVIRDGIVWRTTTATSFADTGRQQSTNYSYQIRAVDNNNTLSTISLEVENDDSRLPRFGRSVRVATSDGRNRAGRLRHSVQREGRRQRQCVRRRALRRQRSTSGPAR